MESFLKVLEYFTRENQSVFDAKKLESSAPNAVSAVALSDPGVSQFDVQVNSLAAAHTVVSNSIPGDEQADIKPGHYEFQLQSGNDSKTIGIDIEEKDTNRDILASIGTAIDQAGFQIGTFLTQYPSLNLDQLTIQGAEQGFSKTFSLNDVTGDLLNHFGISTDHLTLGFDGGLQRPASSAVVKINDTPLTLDSNEFMVNESVKLTISESTEQPATIKVLPDFESIQSKIHDFLNQFNQSLEYFFSLGPNKNQAIFARLRDAAIHYQMQLQSFGVYSNDLGFMTMNSEKFQQALQDQFSNVEQVFEGKDGVAASLFTETQKLLKDQVTPDNGDLTPEADDHRVYNAVGQFLLSQSRFLFASNR